MNSIRVALADDHAMVRAGLTTILNADDALQVVFEAEDGEALISGLLEHPVDVVVSDICMPRLNGIEMVKRLRGGANRLPVILIAALDEGEYLQSSVRAGANGYLLKDVEPDVLVDVIHKVANGQKQFIPQATKAIRGHLNLPSDASYRIEALSERELSVMRLMVAGLCNKEISDCLCISEGTVKNNVSSIISKMSARDRTQAVLRGIRHGVI